MVAQDDAERRSSLAKSLGLGRKAKAEGPPVKERGPEASAKAATSAAAQPTHGLGSIGLPTRRRSDLDCVR